MRSWLTEGVLASSTAFEDIEGYVLGRGLPEWLASEMQIGVWTPPSTPSPDPVFNKRNGERGQYREGWITAPMWSPRGRLAGVEFRTWSGSEAWNGSKEVRDYRTPESRWLPVFIGLTPSVLRRIWEGGDVWLVEGLFDMALYHAIPKKDAVLACGTARVSRLQMDFLRRFLGPAATAHIVFDMDETGRKQITGFTDESTGRFIPGVPARMDRVGIRNRAPSYRGGKDPGEIWEGGGRLALQDSFNLY